MRLHAKIHGAALGLGLAAALLPDAAAAQTPAVLYACYVPATGTVYRIKEPGLPQQCGASNRKGTTVQHVEFSWTDAAGADHGALSGLGDDDHSHYLLADGVRNASGGFAIVSSGDAPVPVTGQGERLMWAAGKSALRAGRIDSYEWDDPWVGEYSVAMGWNALAQGTGSISLGIHTNAVTNGSVALGDQSETEEGVVAIGLNAHAGGGSATAVGVDAFANGLFSTALGYQVSAGGIRSLALGSFATAQDDGSVVISANTDGKHMLSAGDNSFTVRAQNIWFGKDNNVTPTAGRYIETATGAYLSDGGTWTNASDVNLKTAFAPVDGEEVLRKLAGMTVSSWSYRSEDAAVRHIGPTAQDFRVAFGLGDTDRAIATVDADGVSLASIKALAKRTDALREENERLRARLEDLESLVQQLVQSR